MSLVGNTTCVKQHRVFGVVVSMAIRHFWMVTSLSLNALKTHAWNELGISKKLSMVIEMAICLFLILNIALSKCCCRHNMHKVLTIHECATRSTSKTCWACLCKLAFQLFYPPSYIGFATFSSFNFINLVAT